MASSDTQFKKGESGNPVHKFPAGQSGNPGGRPKGFASKIKDLCGDDYDKIARGLYLIAMGTAEERLKFFGEEIKVATKDRVAALRELRDSGPGRPAQTLEHRGDAPALTRVIHEEADVDIS